MKTCTRCQQEKNLEEFPFSKQKGKYHSYCRLCYNEYNREYRKNNPPDKAKERAKQKEWRDKNPDKVKEKWAKWREKNPDYYKGKNKKRRKEDLDFRIRDNIRRRIHHALHNNVKSDKTFN